MQELKERIQKEGKVLPGNIVTVETESILKLCAVIGRYEREYEKAVHI